MSDEIAQVCTYEIEGMKFAVQGTVQAAKFVFTFMKWMCSERYEKGFVGRGEKSFKTILKMSQPDGPGCVMVDKDIVEQVTKEAKKQGLHFHKGADFNPNCSERAFFVPPSELAALTAIYKEAAGNALKEDKVKISEYDGKIENMEQALLDAQNTVAKLMTQLEQLKQAKSEVENQSKTYEEIINSENLSCSFNDFLATMKESEFEKDADKAFTALCNGIDNPPVYTAKECFQPVRDKAFAPASGVHYYLPEIGAVVTRKFEIDKDTGLVYSNYYIKNKEGELHQFTDKGKTNEEWNRYILPDMYEKAGMLEDTKCRVFDSPERLKGYAKSVYKLVPQSEKNVAEKIKKGEKVFSSAETAKEIEYTVDQFVKGKVSAQMDKEEVTLWIDEKSIKQGNGKRFFDLGDEKYLEIPSTATYINEKTSNLRGIRVSKAQKLNILEEDVDLPVYSFATAINLGAVRAMDGTYVIANKGNPDYMAAVRTTDEEITMMVLNKEGKLQEQYRIPNVEENTAEGYLTIQEMKAKYGFGDQIAVYDSVEDAKIHKEHTEKTGGFKVVDSLSAETVANRINSANRRSEAPSMGKENSVPDLGGGRR